MDVKTKLAFSLEVYDRKKSGRISREGLVAVLGGEIVLYLAYLPLLIMSSSSCGFAALVAINATASYFGDAVLQRGQVAVVVDDLFADSLIEDDNAIVYNTGTIYKGTNHPLATEFTSGAGTARYGTAQ